MGAAENEYVMYGMDNYNYIIEKILANLNIDERSDLHFELKLILVEAITNSFVHGNDADKSKAITVRCFIENDTIRLEVEDMGSGSNDFVILKEIPDENLMDFSGRGLYLINSMADSVEIKGNVIVIKKKLIKDIV